MTVTGTFAAWNASLTHEDVGKCRDAALLIGLGAGPEIAAALVVSQGYLETIDLIGGNNGVNISGVLGAMIVTPAGIPIIGEAFQFLSGIINGAANIIATAASAIFHGFGHVFGFAGRGQLHANENNIGDEERFVLTKLPNGKIAICAYTGFFCADSDDWVNADRSAPKQWEEWDLIVNADSSVSLKSYKGKFVATDLGQGNRLAANRDVAAQWEMYQMIWNGDGTMSLKSMASNQFVSAAP